MKIGSRLKALRKERRETQLQVAQAVGMGDRHYQRIENDDGLPGRTSKRTARRISMS